MLPISKGKPPKALSEAVAKMKATPDASPDWRLVDSAVKSETLSALLKEQGSLCAYCMRKISLVSAHVEHYVPQSDAKASDESLLVDYHNLLAVCDGFVGNESGLTCDKARGDKPLYVDPLRHDTLEGIRYRRNGEMYADGGHEQVERDLQTLNLNQELLCRNRKAALEGLYRTLEKLGKNRAQKAVEGFCRQYIEEHLENPGLREPYDGIVIYFMKKRVRAAG